MGTNQSNLSSETRSSSSAYENEIYISAKLSHRHGFQILKVHPNSPISEARLFPYFDYIISINGVEVSPDIPNIIGEMAKNHINKPLKLTIYNSRQDEERELTIVPRTGWGGEGLLGCAIRFSPLEGVRDRVWHILKVHDNSPALKAGLKSEEDYVIASPDILIKTEGEFYELITQNILRQVKLIIFSSKTQDLRELIIVPDFAWGGEGCLGCDVGSGMIHWVPKITSETTTLNKELSEPLTTNDQSQGIAHNQSQGLNQNLGSPQANSLLQPQYQQCLTSQIPSQTSSLIQSCAGSPSKSIAAGNTSNTTNNQPIQQISSSFTPPQVKLPSSRPLLNNLSIDPSYDPNTIINNPIQAPIPNNFHNQPPQLYKQNHNIIIDDIPKPNFTVPSEIINQKLHE